MDRDITPFHTPLEFQDEELGPARGLLPKLARLHKRSWSATAAITPARRSFDQWCAGRQPGRTTIHCTTAATLCITGHIHEAPGIDFGIGRTKILNADSFSAGGYIVVGVLMIGLMQVKMDVTVAPSPSIRLMSSMAAIYATAIAHPLSIRSGRNSSLVIVVACQ